MNTSILRLHWIVLFAAIFSSWSLQAQIKEESLEDKKETGDKEETVEGKEDKQDSNSLQQAKTQPDKAVYASEEIPRAVQTELDALRAELAAVKAHNEERELAELQADVETAITQSPSKDEEALKSKTFKGGERSLQALNPELSVVGDMFARFVYQDGNIYTDDGGDTGIYPRVAGIHFQSNLDPFSYMKIVVGVTPSAVVFGEGYITWNAAASWLSLTVGKFHQQFGVVNRWHAPGLDQFAYPLAVTEHFGGALNQTGISALLTLPPLWAHHLELEIQVTNGENAKLFAGEFFSIPSGLVHMRNYWDLNRNTYLELGLSGLFGVNNERGKPVEGSEVSVQLYDEDGEPVTFYDAEGNPVSIVNTSEESSIEDESWRLTAVGGVDLTLNWEPVNKAKYKGFTWRAEALFAYKQIVNDAGDEDVITSFGAYSYMQYKPIRNWIFGIRGDLTQPFTLDNKDKFTVAAVPYITWWQSPWVRLRLEYDYIHWCDGDPEHRVLLQVTFSAGPHKHERY